MTAPDFEAVLRDPGPVEATREPTVARWRSRDVFGSSPILNDARKTRVGDLVARPGVHMTGLDRILGIGPDHVRAGSGTRIAPIKEALPPAGRNPAMFPSTPDRRPSEASLRADRPEPVRWRTGRRASQAT